MMEVLEATAAAVVVVAVAVVVEVVAAAVAEAVAMENVAVKEVVAMVAMAVGGVTPHAGPTHSGGRNVEPADGQKGEGCSVTCVATRRTSPQL